MTNAEWIIKTGRKFSDIDAFLGKEAVIYGGGERIGTYRGYNQNLLGMTCDDVVKLWLDEKHDVLTDDEKEFLHTLCSKYIPAGNGHRILFKSAESTRSCDYTEICRTLLILDRANDIYAPLVTMKIPTFTFKNVIIDHVYTPEELGI